MGPLEVFINGSRCQAQEPADAGGRHGSRPEGAHSAQDATASERVISTIWRVVFFEREDLPCGAMDPAPPSSVPPKILESVGRHFGVPPCAEYSCARGSAVGPACRGVSWRP